MAKKMKCRGVFSKKDECERDFYYALRDEEIDSVMVTVLYVVDKKGCPIKDGNLIVLPHEDDKEEGILLCDNVNENLGIALSGGVLLHDESCCSDNNYLGGD